MYMLTMAPHHPTYYFLLYKQCLSHYDIKCILLRGKTFWFRNIEKKR